MFISIHAPLRERLTAKPVFAEAYIFQSTLPCGSDNLPKSWPCSWAYFNPRSLAGATRFQAFLFSPFHISIHAPLRERHSVKAENYKNTCISIHAPLRERQHQKKILLFSFKSSIYCELAQLKYSKILF